MSESLGLLGVVIISFFGISMGLYSINETLREILKEMKKK